VWRISRQVVSLGRTLNEVPLSLSGYRQVVGAVSLTWISKRSLHCTVASRVEFGPNFDTTFRPTNTCPNSTGCNRKWDYEQTNNQLSNS